MTRQIVATLLGLVLMAAASQAEALPPLAKNVYINDRLRAAQIADIIRHRCDSLGGRVFYALSEANKLKRYALELGYTREQIEDFVTSSREKARVKAEAKAYMDANGVIRGDAESYCRLGRTEIDRATLAGSLLYRK